MTGPWPTKNSQGLSGVWAQPATAGIGGITTGSPVSRALDTARLNTLAVRHFVLLGRRVYARWKAACTEERVVLLGRASALLREERTRSLETGSGPEGPNLIRFPGTRLRHPIPEILNWSLR